MDYTVHRILQARILELSSLSFLQGIFPNQGSNPHLPHCRWIPAEPQGKPLVSKKSCTGHGSGRPAGRSLNSVWMEQNQGTPCSSLLPLPSTSFPATNLKTIFSAHLCLWDQLTPFFFIFWVCWIFVAAGGLSLVASRDSSSLQWLLLLRSTSSGVCGLQ